MAERVSEEKISEAKELLEQGYSYGRAAAIVGCGKSTLRAWLPGYRAVLLPSARFEAAQAAWKDGVRDAAGLAKRLECTPDHARRLLNKIDPDWARKGPPTASPEVIQRAVSIAQDGPPASWIAEGIGFSPFAVRDWIGKAGLDRSDLSDYPPVVRSIRRRPDLLALHLEFAPV